MDCGVAGVRKARHHAVQSIASLGFTELALDRVSFSSFIPFQKPLLVVDGLILRRATEFGPIHLNAAHLAES